MECADRGGSLDDFMVSQFEIGRLSSPLCFSCYLGSEYTAYDYDEYSPHRRYEEYESRIQDAHSQKNKYKVDLVIEDYQNEGIVLFALTRSDAESLTDYINSSELSQFISETSIIPLTEFYSGDTQQFCWNAANWKYNPYHTHSDRGPSSISVVSGLPCIVDSYRYISDEAENTIFDELLEDFLEGVDVDQLETLGEASTAAKEWFPVVDELDLRFLTHVQNYFRRNPDLLSTTFTELNDDGTPVPSATSASLDELEDLYEMEVADMDTVKEEILALLELAEGARSKDVAKVVNCSESYARRFEYDTDSGRAVEKEWSQDAQREKVSPGTRDRIIERDGSWLRCGDDADLTIHHIIPISADGEARDRNLATLCESCHQAAHGGSYYPPTTVYDDQEGFDAWLEADTEQRSGQSSLSRFTHDTD